jgi:hypothetical protein
MPTEDHARIWQQVERAAGVAVPQVLRAAIEDDEGPQWVSAVADAVEREDREEAFAFLVKYVRVFAKHGVFATPVEREQIPASDDSARIRLLNDLETLLYGGPAYEPMSAYRLDFDPLTHEQRRNRVTVEFDARLSLRAVMGQLRELWPLLRKRRWVRYTKDLGDRKVELVRFVCETMPDATWRERFGAWQSARPEWPYPSAQAFASDFHRAEQSLTGYHYGLDSLYDALAKLPDAELQARADAGNRKADEILMRRFARSLHVGTSLETAEWVRRGDPMRSIPGYTDEDLPMQMEYIPPEAEQHGITSGDIEGGWEGWLPLRTHPLAAGQAEPPRTDDEEEEAP